jgi:hypothetical protein
MMTMAGTAREMTSFSTGAVVMALNLASGASDPDSAAFWGAPLVD